MKKTHYVTIIILLLISNVFTIFFYSDFKLNYTKEFTSNINEAYLLEGENSNWIFKGGNLFLGSYREQFIGSSIKYIGTKELNTDVIIANISIRDKNTHELQGSLGGCHSSSNDFNTASLNGTLDLFIGSGSRFSDSELEYDYDLTSNSRVYVDIEYKLDGKLIKESFELKTIPLLSN
ncbi:hypothetical protein [Oceanirhabdus seepicola]|uniref:Uncharacterized protein n=1 Tax=Oceanirhabdus seepicola TaxID=2828781 RepID=A0A9J6NZS6_9CLOT|nr:hypothetical protein [Oceanirhabdus seepicola]MCM1989596.1 hypothetical protein [Oceanirhabdus seepicola]